MQRHDRDRAVAVVDLVGRGEQGDIGEEVDQGALGADGAELLRLRDELLEVLGASLVLRVAAVLQRREVPRPREDLGENVVRRGRGGDGRELVQQLPQLDDRGGHLRAEAELAGVDEGLAQGHPHAVRVRLQGRLGGGADAALGHVHDAAQRHVVVGVGDLDEVGHRVLDLGALVELGAAGDAVRNR